MRTVLRTHDEADYARAWRRLSEHGIPVLEPEQNAEGLGVTASPLPRVLCIWLDHQYEDALQLLANPSHVVTTAVDPAEFADIQALANNAMNQSVDELTKKALNWIAVIAVVLAITWLVWSIRN